MTFRRCCEVAQSQLIGEWDVLVADHTVALRRVGPQNTAPEVWESTANGELLHYGFLPGEDGLLLGLGVGVRSKILIRPIFGRGAGASELSFRIDPPLQIAPSGLVTWSSLAPGNRGPVAYHLEIRDPRTGALLTTACATDQPFDLDQLPVPAGACIVSGRAADAVAQAVYLDHLPDAAIKLWPQLDATRTPWTLSWSCPADLAIEHHLSLQAETRRIAASGRRQEKVMIGDTLRFRAADGRTLACGALRSVEIMLEISHDRTLRVTGSAGGSRLAAYSPRAGERQPWAEDAVAEVLAAYERQVRNGADSRISRDAPAGLARMRARTRDGRANPEGLAPRPLVEAALGCDAVALGALFAPVDVEVAVTRLHAWLTAGEISLAAVGALGRRLGFWRAHEGILDLELAALVRTPAPELWSSAARAAAVARALIRLDEALQEARNAAEATRAEGSAERVPTREELDAISSPDGRAYWEALGREPLFAQELEVHVPHMRRFAEARALAAAPTLSTGTGVDVADVLRHHAVAVPEAEIRARASELRRRYATIVESLPTALQRTLPDADTLAERVRVAATWRAIDEQVPRIRTRAADTLEQLRALHATGLFGAPPPAVRLDVPLPDLLCAMEDGERVLDAWIEQFRARLADAPPTVRERASALLAERRWGDVAASVAEHEAEKRAAQAERVIILKANEVLDRSVRSVTPDLGDLLRWIPHEEAAAAWREAPHAARRLVTVGINDHAGWNACIARIQRLRAELLGDFVARVTKVRRATDPSAEGSPWHWAQAARSHPDLRRLLIDPFPHGSVWADNGES